MAAHTPGLWFTYKDGFACTYPENRFAEIEIRNSDHVIIASSRKRDIPPSEHAANVRLIAAAPELLEALQQAHAQMAMAAECIEAKRYSEAIVHVDTMSIRRQSIIAKATGAAP